MPKANPLLGKGAESATSAVVAGKSTPKPSPYTAIPKIIPENSETSDNKNKPKLISKSPKIINGSLPYVSLNFRNGLIITIIATIA